MGRYIIKINDKFFLWSTVVDAPITYGLTMDELTESIRFEYGQRGVDELPERLERVQKHGHSALFDMTLAELLDGNRAGENETTITVDEIYQKYAVPPTESQVVA